MTLSAYGDRRGGGAGRRVPRDQPAGATLSRTIAASDVSRLNAGGAVTVSEETADPCWLRPRPITAATGGAFDMTVAPLVSLWGITSDAPHVPSQEEIDALLPLVGSEHVHMDGSIVSTMRLRRGFGRHRQGLRPQQVADILRPARRPPPMVSLGGNVYVCGAKPDG